MNKTPFHKDEGIRMLVYLAAAFFIIALYFCLCETHFGWNKHVFGEGCV